MAGVVQGRVLDQVADAAGDQHRHPVRFPLRVGLPDVGDLLVVPGEVQGVAQVVGHTTPPAEMAGQEAAAPFRIAATTRPRDPSSPSRAAIPPRGTVLIMGWRCWRQVPMSEPRPDVDSPWKDALERFFPACMAPLLCGGTRGSTGRGREFLDKELQRIAPRVPGPPRVDKLAKVYLLDGGEIRVLVHLEYRGSQTRDSGAHVRACATGSSTATIARWRASVS